MCVIKKKLNSCFALDINIGGDVQDKLDGLNVLLKKAKFLLCS